MSQLHRERSSQSRWSELRSEAAAVFVFWVGSRSAKGSFFEGGLLMPAAAAIHNATIMTWCCSCFWTVDRLAIWVDRVLKSNSNSFGRMRRRRSGVGQFYHDTQPAEPFLAAAATEKKLRRGSRENRRMLLCWQAALQPSREKWRMLACSWPAHPSFPEQTAVLSGR